jgi:hypothetical protein
MDWDADLKEINAHYAVERDEALAKLRASRSKKAKASVASLKWSWRMAVFLGQPLTLAQVVSSMATQPSASATKKAHAAKAAELALRETDLQAFCDQKIQGEYHLTLVCENLYGSSRVTGRAPASLLGREAPTPIPAAAPARVLRVYQPGNRVLPEGVYQKPILGAYRKKGDVVRLLEDDEHCNALHELDPATGEAFYTGGMHRRAAEAFKAAAAGGVFRYRNQPFVRLPDAEVDALLANHAVWLSGGFRDGSDSGLSLSLAPKAKAQRPSASTPVFPPGADHDETLRKPIGTAGSMGLVAATAVVGVAAKKAKTAKP